MAFGDRLAEVRRGHGLTQEQFAEQLQVSRQAVSKWESGRGYPEIEKTPRKEKIVTFLGRITMQKGPEYFVEAAAMVLKKVHNVRFVMAGGGDMMEKMIRLAEALHLRHRL